MPGPVPIGPREAAECGNSSRSGPSPSVLRAGRRLLFRKRNRLTVSAVLMPTSLTGVLGRNSSGSSAKTTALATSPPAAGTFPRPGLPTSWWTAVAGTQAFAGQLLGTLWVKDAAQPKQEDPGRAGLQSLLNDTTKRAREAEDLERRASDVSDKKAVHSLEPFLKQTGVMETRYIRKLSNLCALTYRIPTLTSRDLWKRHKMKLVTTSLAVERSVGIEAPRTARQVFLEADAMAINTAQVAAVAKELEELQLRKSAALATWEKVEAGKAKTPQSPTDLVAAMLKEAASAAANAAAPLANNISTFTTNVVPMHSMASAMQSAAAAGHSTAAATIATVTAAVEATWSQASSGGSGRKAVAAAKDAVDNPTDWFVVDDAQDGTRYFVLMGSDNIDHWRTNITFDPIAFEDGKLGAMVHRGVYEAAQVLYERFLPLVEEHVRGNPFAKVAFTGHSLGGSIGTLLVMMYVYRGVLSPANLQTTYTFGSPAIFCEGSPACGCAVNGPAALTAGEATVSCGGPPSPPQPGADAPQARADARARGRAAAARPDGVLARLGLKEGSVKNVIMHRDIVPRAFACDYTLVADLLKRVGSSFKQHSCLAGPHRQAMYYFVGKVLVLQPDERLTFVKGKGFHPSLPAKPGLWLLREPSLLGTAATAAVAEAASLTSGRPNPERPPVPANVVDAVHKLMDTPHPLDILGQPEAYGDDGSISRYHNPDNYTRAIGGVLRTKAFWMLVPPASGAGSPNWYMPLRGAAAGSRAAGGSSSNGRAAIGFVGNHSRRQLPAFQVSQRSKPQQQQLEGQA